jgi:hypothetical protein
MTKHYDKVRLLVAKRHDEESAIVIGAYPESLRGVTLYEEWDAWKRTTAQGILGSDSENYEYVEAIATIPNEELVAMFVAREITPTKVEPA